MDKPRDSSNLDRTAGSGKTPKTDDEILTDSTEATTDDSADADESNPPRTTTGFWTSPKFGSAGSGGAEFEPGPEAD